MSNVTELSDMGNKAKRLLDLLDSARLTRLDFDNREHLQVIALCLDMAIDRVKEIK